MRLRFYIFFAFFTLLFLFYPGDSYYFHIFAYNRETIDKNIGTNDLKMNSVPYLKNPLSFPSFTAEGAYVVDLPSFTPLMARNENVRFLPASTTKILTALVAFDVYKPDDVISIKRTIADGQLMGLVVGEKITVENLLYGTLVYSGNDAAYVLADNYGFDKYLTLMNKKAQDLGMKNSQFKNSDGIDAAGQYTSAFDLALAARELLKNPYLAKIVSIKAITVSDVDFKYFHQLTNVNQLLGEIAGIGGLKTGYTEEAGENLVSFYKYQGHEYVIVILKSLDRFGDTKNIVNWLTQNVDYLPAVR